jgi:hypothetical protein
MGAVDWAPDCMIYFSVLIDVIKGWTYGTSEEINIFLKVHEGDSNGSSTFTKDCDL